MQLSEKPNFVIVTKLTVESCSSLPEIITCNSVDDEQIISAWGGLPTEARKQSYGECEIEFIGVGSAVIGQLSKYDGMQIGIFETENDCSLEINPEINTITIQCSKQERQKINMQFTKTLEDIKEMYKHETRSFKQTQHQQLTLSAGGQVSTFGFKEGELLGDMLVIKNLAPEIGIQELKELFDEFVQTKSIKFMDNTDKHPENNQSMSIISQPPTALSLSSAPTRTSRPSRCTSTAASTTGTA
jgi:hypothetical protein